MMKKVLIVEAELLIGRVLKLVLEKNNFEVLHLPGPEGLEDHYKNFKPNAVVMDVSLNTKINGIELAKFMRKNGCTCPIIFTTGNSYNQTKTLISEIENTHLFIKPVDSERLAVFIKEICI